MYKTAKKSHKLLGPPIGKYTQGHLCADAKNWLPENSTSWRSSWICRISGPRESPPKCWGLAAQMNPLEVVQLLSVPDHLQQLHCTLVVGVRDRKEGSQALLRAHSSQLYRHRFKWKIWFHLWQHCLSKLSLMITYSFSNDLKWTKKKKQITC